MWWGSCERQDIAEGGVGSVKECVCVCVWLMRSKLELKEVCV